LSQNVDSTTATATTTATTADDAVVVHADGIRRQESQTT
jgi:hypothetical protein